jgi:hypothetical protein
VAALAFNVTVHDGVVDLWGSPMRPKKEGGRRGGGECAGRVSVNNHIIVRPHNWAEAKPFFAATSAKT